MPGPGNQHFLRLLTQEARLQPHERARAAGALLQQSRLPASRTIGRCGRHWDGKLGGTPRRHDHRTRERERNTDAASSLPYFRIVPARLRRGDRREAHGERHAPTVIDVPQIVNWPLIVGDKKQRVGDVSLVPQL